MVVDVGAFYGFMNVLLFLLKLVRSCAFQRRQNTHPSWRDNSTVVVVVQAPIQSYEKLVDHGWSECTLEMLLLVETSTVYHANLERLESRTYE